MAEESNFAMVYGGEGSSSKGKVVVHRNRFEDKQTGDYHSVRTREKTTSQEVVDKSTGRLGAKQEHKMTFTHNFGNKHTGFAAGEHHESKYYTYNYSNNKSSRKYLN